MVRKRSQVTLGRMRVIKRECNPNLGFDWWTVCLSKTPILDWGGDSSSVPALRKAGPQKQKAPIREKERSRKKGSGKRGNNGNSLEVFSVW